MWVYIGMMLVSMGFAYMAARVRGGVAVTLGTLIKKNQRIKQAWIFAGLAVLSALPFIVVSGLRYDVGTDYFFTYVPMFDRIAAGVPFAEIDVEPGFWLLNVIIQWMGGGYVWLFTLTSAFVICFMWKGIFDQSAIPWLSIAIFVLGEGFFVSMNGVRQYMALAVVFFGFRYVKERRFWKYALCVLFGALFHMTILVFLPVYFLRYLRGKAAPLVVLGSVLLVSLLNGPMKTLFDFIVSKTPYGNYVGSEFQVAQRFYPARIMIYVVVIALALLSYYLTENGQKPEYRFLLYLEIIALFLALNRNIFPLTDRFCWYFEVAHILIIPAIVAAAKKWPAKIGLAAAPLGVMAWVAYDEIVLRLFHEVIPYQLVYWPGVAFY